MKCINMAIEMLGGDYKTDYLHSKLAERLILTEELCTRLGGPIQSREVVACIVADWIVSNSKEMPIKTPVEE